MNGPHARGSATSDPVSTITETVLVLTADERGRLRRTDSVEALVGGAMLADLAHDGLLALRKTRSDGAILRLSATPGDAVSASVIAALSRDPTLDPRLLTGIGRVAYDEGVERLIVTGAAVRESSRVLGFSARTRTRLADEHAADNTRAALQHAASDSDPVDGRIATIVTLLDGAGELDRLLGGRAAMHASSAAQSRELLRSIVLAVGAAAASAATSASH